MRTIFSTATLVAVLISAPVQAQHSNDLVVDLTHPIDAEAHGWAGAKSLEVTIDLTIDQGVRANSYSFSDGLGTNMDSPAHFIHDGHAIHDIPAADLIAEGVVIDVTASAAEDPTYALTREDVLAWEAKNGTVPEGSFVIVHTGWWQHYDDPESYWNIDEYGTMRFPGVSGEAAELLVERGIIGLGIDTHSADPGNSSDYAAHRVLLGADLYIVEALTNLDRLPVSGFRVSLGVLPVKDAPQIQLRALALIPQG